jgi:exonuclease SbcC
MSQADVRESYIYSLDYKTYANSERRALETLLEQERQLGYDEGEHAAATLLLRGELSGASEKHQFLKAARTVIESLNDQITSLEAKIEQKKTAAVELEQATEQLALLHRTGLSVESAEREVQRFEGEQIKVHQRIAIVQRSIDRIKELEVLQEAQLQEKSEVAQRIRRLTMLEKTCGREGVQALLIENVLPEIEDDANEILERLTDGQMQIALETQRQHKTSDRVAETLDIHIADSEGVRPYENYSGGEQFRVNFALRLALSRILARRSGAKLQTLVIDEGFGSQDPAGRQRLLEAIDIVSADFKLILIVSHIEEMRDAFETWISVEKDASGSAITVT